MRIQLWMENLHINTIVNWVRNKNNFVEKVNTTSREAINMTQKFNIGEIFNNKSRRWRSKDSKQKNLHQNLYKDAVNRKSRQEKRINNINQNQNQSVRSFLKNTHSSFNYKEPPKSARVNSKKSSEKKNKKIKKLYKGSPNNWFSQNRFHKWASIAQIKSTRYLHSSKS